MKNLTLAEYRENVLGLRQSDVALKAGCAQSWISQVERGHLPKPWNREQIMRGYGLTQKQEPQFVSMIQTAKRLKALPKPMRETEPLFAAAPANADVSPIIGLEDQMHRVARGEIAVESLIADMRKTRLA